MTDEDGELRSTTGKSLEQQVLSKEAAAMVRHREGIYWQGVKSYSTVVSALVAAGGALWATVDATDARAQAVLPIVAFAAALVSVLGSLVTYRQGGHLDIAWRIYRAEWCQWDDHYPKDSAGLARDDGPKVRTLVFCTVLAAAALLVALGGALLGRP